MQRLTVDPFREWLSLQHCPACGSRGRFKLGPMQPATSSRARQVVVECACGKKRAARPAVPAMGKTKVTMTPPTWLED